MIIAIIVVDIWYVCAGILTAVNGSSVCVLVVSCDLFPLVSSLIDSSLLSCARCHMTQNL